MDNIVGFISFSITGFIGIHGWYLIILLYINYPKKLDVRPSSNKLIQVAIKSRWMLMLDVIWTSILYHHYYLK